MFEYYPTLKNIFLLLACNPSYPSVDWKEFLKFIDQCAFIDENATMHEIDRAFVATNIELEKLDENPDRELCRFEFLEIITRIGIIKYFDSKICSTYSAAVYKVVTEDVLPRAPSAKEFYEDYRFANIYNIEIDELFKTNLSSLEKLYRNNKTVVGVHIDKITEIVEKGEINLDENEIIYCFAHSKMTVVDEMQEGNNIHFIQLVPRLMLLSY